MADNEGPKRSDFQESSKLPACGPGCEVEHGDQADPEQLELMHLRAEVKRLRSTSQELEIDRLRARVGDLEEQEKAGVKDYLDLRDAADRAIVKCDGALAEAAAAKRERDVAQLEADSYRQLVADPVRVRSAVLRGGIAVPEDLVWLHDTNGPVALKIAEEREACARLADEASDLFNAIPSLGHTQEMRGMDAAANLRARSIAAAIRARGGP